MTRRYGPLVQATMIVVVGSLLGVGYNAVTNKGMFSSQQAGYRGWEGLRDGRSSQGGVSRPAADSSDSPEGKPVSSHGSNGSTSPVPISRGDAVALFDSGCAVFVDARHKIDYDLGHIRGAISLPAKTPAEEFLSRLGDIPKEVAVVTYCDGAECNSSLDLAVRLEKAGFTNVKVFFGGWNEWQVNSLPTEGSK